MICGFRDHLHKERRRSRRRRRGGRKRGERRRRRKSRRRRSRRSRRNMHTKDEVTILFPSSDERPPVRPVVCYIKKLPRRPGTASLP